MYISKLRLQNFKRFTDLTIDLLALKTPPKLVLLIGTNGSGKSSVFDALNLVGKSRIEKNEKSYYIKDNSKEAQFHLTFKNNQTYHFSSNMGGLNPAVVGWEDKLYGRTSFRQLLRLEINSLKSIEPSSFDNNYDKSTTFVDADNRFENDLIYLTEEILNAIFKEKTNAITSAEIVNRYVSPINEAFDRIFGGEEQKNTTLKFHAYFPPLQGSKLRLTFSKGQSDEFDYDLLSAGEKEVFNIILNLLHRTRYFKDTIYYIDELDLHLNTILQKALIKEIVENWIPENCQLWTASHSLGFIEYANESDNATIIDLDNLDFDQEQEIYPKEKNNFENFEVAIPASSLAQLLKGKSIIFAERTDTEYYNKLNLVNQVFVNAVDRNDVFGRVETTANFGLVDRDFLTDEEVEELHILHPRLMFLAYYCFENYLYHPDNIQEALATKSQPFDKSNYVKKITEEKNKLQSDIALIIESARNTYPYFKQKQERRKQFSENKKAVLNMLKSDVFEEFYKVFSMKDFCGKIRENNQLKKSELAQTNWFKSQIEKIILTK
jgi:AAA15 family ATPase/GTPase